MVARTGDKAKVASVLLLTDGLANVGISNREGIMDEMRKVIDPPGGKAVSVMLIKLSSAVIFYVVTCSSFSHLRVLYILLDLVLTTMLAFLSLSLHKEEECTIILITKKRY